MAELWAKKILSGAREYSEVPRLLKAKVKQILIDNGREDLTND